MSEVFLSVVMPAYNEERRLAAALDDVFGTLAGFPRAWEVLVVDDGSADRTAALALERAAREPRLRLVRRPHQGKGAAIRAGMAEARGRYRLFRDADLSTPMRALDRFLPLLDAGRPVVVGSRRVAGASIERHQGRLRETMGKVFTLLCRALLVWEVRDYTCGFKCFSAEAAGRIFPRQRVSGWGFDAEILFIAWRLGYPIDQVPVTWRDEPGSKVRLLRDALGSFREILAIRLNDLRGRYRGGPS